MIANFSERKTGNVLADMKFAIMNIHCGVLNTDKTSLVPLQWFRHFLYETADGFS